MNLNRLRRLGVVALAAATVALAPIVLPVVALTPGAGAAEQDLGTDDPFETVSADPLPAPSINGVVWDQEVVGSTVYAVGEFTTATTPDGSSVTRTNALAYDITTGALLDWAPSTDGAVRAVTASPDGGTVYLGGSFTRINGLVSYRVGAVDPASGATRSLGLHLNASVNALAVSADGARLYAGGGFTAANDQRRLRVVEYDLASRSVTSFSPSIPNQYVRALALEPGGTGVAVGGAFTSVNGSRDPGEGIAILEAGTGELRYNQVSSVIGAGGVKDAVFSLTTDSRGLYGTSYSQTGSFEGVVRLNWKSGAVEWMLDCHGDSYDSFPSGDVVYISSHEHDCSNVGQFPNDAHHYYNATAAINDAVTTVGPNTHKRYTDFRGQPGTQLLSFFPRFTAGTYTGTGQATWTVEGNQDYVVYGGEFTAVNGQQQQGLVRFAKRELAPNKVNAENRGGAYTFRAESERPGVVSFSWQANWDRDDRMLTYEIFRDTTHSKPVWTRKAASTFWELPALTATDFVDPGSEHRYRIRVTDKWGASTQTDWLTITAKDGVGLPAYARQVMADGATGHWSMDETSGRRVADSVGMSDARISGRSWNRGVAGAMDSGASVHLGGDSAIVASRRVPAPTAFSEEAWFRTTSRAGGLIIGLGSSSGASSRTKDRVIYMTDRGAIVYGLYPGRVQTLESPHAYNDGKWHHVVATTSPTGGSVLYLDGVAVAQDATMTAGEDFRGYWHIGGDRLSGFPSEPTSSRISADIDEVAVYDVVLSPEQVGDHFSIGVHGAPTNRVPTAEMSVTAAGLEITADGSASNDLDGSIVEYKWSWGDGSPEETSTQPTAKHTFAAAGTYTVSLAVTDNGGKTGTTEQQVTVSKPIAPAPDNPGGAIKPEDPVPGGGEADKPADPGQGGAGDQAAVFLDTFSVDMASSWGTANKGGDWSSRWGRQGLSVANGYGQISMQAAGSGSRVMSPALDKADTDLTTTFRLDALPDRGRLYINQDVRLTDKGAYRLKVIILPDGSGKVELLKVTGGSERWLAEAPVKDLKVGQDIHLHLKATGQSEVMLAASLWVGDTEPASWDMTYKDTKSPLSDAGAIALDTYLAGAGNAIVFQVDEIRAV